MCPSRCQEAPPASHAGWSKVQIGNDFGLQGIEPQPSAQDRNYCLIGYEGSQRIEHIRQLPVLQLPYLFRLDIVQKHLLLIDTVELVLVVRC